MRSTGLQLVDDYIPTSLTYFASKSFSLIIFHTKIYFTQLVVNKNMMVKRKYKMVIIVLNGIYIYIPVTNHNFVA